MVDEALSLLARVETLMKEPPFEAELNTRKANVSFALLAIEGLQAYLQGDVDDAQSCFATVAEEISARREFDQR